MNSHYVKLAGKVFQSTPPQGGRLGSPRYQSRFLSFNPRPRRGGDVVIRPPPPPVRGVSIHAPAGGATACDYNQSYSQQVSIHAPAGGATHGQTSPGGGKIMFQSTPPQGGRPSTATGERNTPRVSIHAPAGGATQFCIIVAV